MSTQGWTQLWSLSCVVSDLNMIFFKFMILLQCLYTYYLHIVVLTTQKNKKVGTIISVFQNYFWGYAGVRLVNVKWLTLTLWMFWMILWFSFSAQAKTKKRSLLFVHDCSQCLMAEVVWKVPFYVGARIETQF